MASDQIAADILVRVNRPDRYVVHAALDGLLGRRGEVGYLWTIGRAGGQPAARVRLPLTHPMASSGMPVCGIPAGTQARFRLVATIKRHVAGTGKRSSWPREETAPRIAWLRRRGEAGGFRVLYEAVAADRAMIDRKGHRFWVDETVFSGALEVTDETLFARTLTSGVGQRNAFGFGLLEVF